MPFFTLTASTPHSPTPAPAQSPRRPSADRLPDVEKGAHRVEHAEAQRAEARAGVAADTARNA